MPLRRQPAEREGDRRSRDHRGAALVEAAIVLPVVIALLFGVVEYGFIFKDELTISNATRVGARMAAADGNASLADYDILTAVKSGATALPANAIQQVIVYKAAAGNGTVPSACTAIPVTQASPAGVNTGGVYCNVYGQTVMNSALSSSNFGGTSGMYDSYWNPTTRNVTQGSSDYVGVYIKIKHNYFTGMFGSSRTMADQTVARIEPTQ